MKIKHILYLFIFKYRIYDIFFQYNGFPSDFGYLIIYCDKFILQTDVLSIIIALTFS